MKKGLSILLVLTLMAALLAGCGGETTPTPGGAENGQTPSGGARGEVEYIMKLANPNPAGDIKDRVALHFEKLVEERSNGRVDIQVYSGGQLGDWRATVEGLKLGTNEIVLGGMGEMSAYTDLANIDSVPYLYESTEQYLAFIKSELGREVFDTVAEDGGFRFFGPMYRGVRVTTSKKPFHNLEELKGLKIRVPNVPIMLRTWEVLGASPTPLALTDVFTALQQNTVEAQENSIQESYGYGFYDVCDYLIRTDHSFSTDMFVFDRTYFDNLPEDIQTVVSECAEEAAQWRTETTLAEEEEYLQKWADEGVTIIEDVDVESMREAVKNIVDEDYPYLVELRDKIAAFED